MKTGIIYFVNEITYIQSESLVKNFYKETGEINADYVLLHGLNLNNYNLLMKYKPKNETIIIWYLDNQIYLVEKDPTDKLW